MKHTVPILFLFLVSCSAAEKKSGPLVTNKLPRDTTPVLFAVKNIVDLSIPNRTVGRSGHKKTFGYLKNEFEKIAKAAGGKVFVHDFKPDVKFAAKTYQNDFDNLVVKKFKKEDATYKKWDAFTKAAIKFVNSFGKYRGKNIVLELPGTENAKEIIYVGAHYDSITHNHETMEFTPDAVAPAADDNASGLAAMLVAAQKIAATPHKKTVRFVAFDFEEIFFLGSTAFARDLKQQKFGKKGETYLGLINLEMIGWSKKKPILKIYTRDKNPEDNALAENVKNSAGALDLDAQILANGFNRSDNWPFWENGLHAVTLSEDWENDFNEKNYHTANDTADSLNYAYLAEVAELVTASLQRIAN
jgi:Zn-dependent M28 family amino/carboxypeptidase